MARDIAVRATKTFWQASIAYIVATISTQLAGVDVFDADALKGVIGSLLIGALAAGISASWNGVIQPLLDKYKRGD